MQDGIDLINARRAASGDRPAAGAQALWLLHQRGRRAGRRRSISEHRRSIYLRQRLRDQADGRAADACRRSSTTRATGTRAIRGRSSSSSRSLKEVGWNGLLGERRADAARQHGAAALRAARRQRLGARAAAGSRAAHAGAHEFRGAARDEPEVQPARRRRGRGQQIAGGAAVVRARPADAAPTSRPRRYNALLDYARAGGAWTGSDDAARDEGARASCT